MRIPFANKHRAYAQKGEKMKNFALLLSLCVSNLAIADNFRITRVDENCASKTEVTDSYFNETRTITTCQGYGGYEVVITTEDDKISLKLKKGRALSQELVGYRGDTKLGSNAILWSLNDINQPEALIYKLSVESPVTRMADHDRTMIVKIDGSNTCVVDDVVPNLFYTTSMEAAKNISNYEYCMY